MRDIPHINSALDSQEKRLEEHENRIKGIERREGEMSDLIKTTNDRLHEVAMAISGNPEMGIKGIVSAVEEVGRKHDHLSSLFERLSLRITRGFAWVGGAGFILVVIWEAFKFYAQYLQDKH